MKVLLFSEELMCSLYLGGRCNRTPCKRDPECLRHIFNKKAFQSKANRLLPKVNKFEHICGGPVAGRGPQENKFEGAAAVTWRHP